MTLRIKCFHTQKRKEPLIKLKIPMPGEGYEQWLGDGYYFWEDKDFAVWWGRRKKCGPENKTRYWDIYEAELFIDEENFIDTVFNENDYRQFVKKIENFADRYSKKYRVRPTLTEFNDFIADYNVWPDIEAIRFQDVPENNEFVKVTGFYYKKRIQIRVNNPDLISNFVHLNHFICI